MENLRETLRLSEDPLGGAVRLDRETVERIDRAIEASLEEGQGASYLTLLNPLLQGKDAGGAVVYAAASLQARVGDEAVARQLFLRICERLEHQENWEGLASVLEPALRYAASPELARAAARAWEKGGSSHVSLSLLERAHALNGEDRRVLWALGRARVEAGDAGGLDLVARSLPGFAEHKQIERIEEGVLYILEDPSRERLADVLLAIDHLVRAGEASVAVNLFEIAHPAFSANGLAAEEWALLRRALEKSTDREAYRKAAAAAGIAAHASLRDPQKLLDTAGVANRDVPTEDALAMLDRLLEMPPGRHVSHQGWGVGEILENDGETLHLRFDEKGDHRMSVSLARTALTLLDPTDLRVKVFRDREGMMAALKKNRADFLYHVLEHLKGEATQDEIKKTLVTLGILVPSRWADWWKGARKEAEADARFDFSRFFRKVVRIRSAKELSSPLPEVDLARRLRKGLDLLFRFLDQHPEESGHVAARYGEELRSIAAEDTRPASERLLAHLLLRFVGIADPEGFQAALAAFTRYPDLGPFSTEQQKALLELAPEDRKGPVAAVLLDSKAVAVRKEAWAVFREREEREICQVLDASPSRPNAVLHVARELIDGDSRCVWTCVHALISIVESPERETFRKHALEMLVSPAFRERMRSEEATPEEARYLRNRLIEWKHSERHLYPILEVLEPTPLRAIAEEVEAKRRSLRPQAEKDAYDRYGDWILMARATLVRLQKEVETLDWDLKTTIPREIQKAREYGDLSENAEYDAAKQKQAEVSRRLDELRERVRRARAIEEIEVREDEAGPGTEVDLVSDSGETRTYWILGEGDRDFSGEVVSYRAPLGGLLLGKRVGDEVGPIMDRTFRIVAIRKRLPAGVGGEES
ncbi:MAG: GreA/GreB family elongation factor [Candidatus Eisenbacteria bacterium]